MDYFDDDDDFNEKPSLESRVRQLEESRAFIAEEIKSLRKLIFTTSENNLNYSATEIKRVHLIIWVLATLFFLFFR